MNNEKNEYKKSTITQEDNSFVISGLQSGSFLLEVSNPDFYYEPVRVDVNSKGKVRARKVNNVQPSQVNQLPYPLRLKSPGRFKYFQQREEWKISDMLMNPMIIMMVLPLLLITVLPKMMNDPETKREMEQMQQQMNVNNQVNLGFLLEKNLCKANCIFQMPDVSELLASYFGGGAAEKPKRKQVKPSLRR